MLQLRKELHTYFFYHKFKLANILENDSWLSKLIYLADICLNLMKYASLKSITLICPIPKLFKFRKITFVIENKCLGRICPIRSQKVKPDFQKIMSKKQIYLTKSRQMNYFAK